MGFYFCGRYICTESDEKKIERNMYAVISYFQDSNDQHGYEEWEN